MPTTAIVRGTDGTEITVHRWDPDRAPIGVLQMTHGVGEHALRYAHVAEEFTALGYVVYAQDHRGHGATAGSPDRFGQIGAAGWTGLVSDIGVLIAHARAEHPGLPLVLLAHSLGSWATQQYLVEHSDTVDAVALTGTAALDRLGAALTPGAPLGLEMFNGPFQPARTDFDWLSRDEAVVDAYVADPRCGFMLDPDAMAAVFAGAERAATPEATARIRRDLPIYLCVGAHDPVNGGLAFFDPLVERYRAAGLPVTAAVYPEARHEVLNETNRDEVLRDLTTWVRSALVRG